MTAMPKAHRAVGTAVAHNNIAMLIPCHRVTRENGDAGLYRWGLDRKRAIIGWEQSRRVMRSKAIGKKWRSPRTNPSQLTG